MSKPKFRRKLSDYSMESSDDEIKEYKGLKMAIKPRLGRRKKSFDEEYEDMGDFLPNLDRRLSVCMMDDLGGRIASDSCDDEEFEENLKLSDNDEEDKKEVEK